MPGLALKLAPREQVLINGVIVENGPRRTQIVIMSEDAAILRMREALDPSEVIGPASRAYFAAQTALAGMIPKDAGYDATENFDILAARYRDEGMLKAVNDAREAFLSGNFYRAMRCLKPCVEHERERIANT
jgi:flagellar protein FlbT